MSCRNCSHWRGNKYSEWADCYRILHHLSPDLRYCMSSSEVLEGVPVWIPFDPHDIQYFNKNTVVKRLIRQVTRSLPPGVQHERIDNMDFFQTRKDFACPYLKLREIHV